MNSKNKAIHMPTKNIYASENLIEFDIKKVENLCPIFIL